MPDYMDRRTPALYRSTTAPTTPSLGYSTGDIPPELSPLDELAIRGRMLRKQLGNDGSLGLNPQTVHRSLRQPNRSPGPPVSGPGFLERSFSVDSQQHTGGRVGGFGIQFTSPNEQDRPVSSYPRFSTAGSIVSYRDSNASALTITPESIKSPESEQPPNLSGFDFGPGSTQLDNNSGSGNRDATSPTDKRGDYFGGFKKGEVPAPPVRHDSGLELPESERETIQEERAGGPRTGAVLSAARDTSASPGSNRSRQPPNATYQAYNPKIHAPQRQQSKDGLCGLRIPPPRNDSWDSGRGRSPLPSPIPPLGNVNANDSRNDVPNSILPLLDTIRASSPENVEDDPSNLNFPLSPSQSASSPKVGEDNYDWLHDFQNSSGPTTPRPPSAGSQKSFQTIGGTRVAQKPINFSRPMLSARPSVDISVATDYLRSPNPNEHTPLQTPISRAEEPIGTAETHDDGIPSYTYTRFYLPRGRILDRNSLILLDDPQLPDGGSQQQQRQPPPPQIQQQQPHRPQHQNEQPLRKQSYTAYTPSSPIKPISRSTSSPAPGSRPQQPSSDYVSQILRQQTAQTQRAQRPTISTSTAPRSPHLGPPGSVSPNLSRSSGADLQPPKMVRPNPSKENTAPTAALTPDEHVTLGIERHEKGSLQESAYHLRHAANASHPTGMLLYALSLRHGWGMKANPQEAIVWLKKVIQAVGGDPADSEMGAGALAGDFLEKQGRKAQYALSIYELGMCHLNGWGTGVDKAYALKCFEMAGKWGDADALSEAGYCYAQGIGIKKDMKKSAKYYRMAEAKGINMVGNSWIWKDKYLDDEERREKARKEGKPDPTTEKHGGFFGRKKH
ncbi:hypothetical protein L211DRAFT_846737 [Terfezia boudieri ATCC MYA-4762]|uniref:HCP-like protein n=1 Tax=Terfezia boudieri ATCC MYA-4762 TaxID=1051890 RepID=A0A3N4LWB5_9PEZI|nr:hypothetical protein L211DRAFT_846737 [Terfezia boudieri ATCC MYA-4762]